MRECAKQGHNLCNKSVDVLLPPEVRCIANLTSAIGGLNPNSAVVTLTISDAANCHGIGQSTYTLLLRDFW